MKISGARAVCEVLKEQNVDTVFAYPGGCVIELFDELYNCRDNIKHIITAHEQGAAHAADGYARACGKCGVVIATSGPGATNLVTGIAAAYMDSVPIVAITGNVSVNDIGKDSFQEVYTEGIFMPITKHTFVVREASKLADTLREAFYLAQHGRRGPVLVDIPKNIFSIKAHFEKAESAEKCEDFCVEEKYFEKISKAKKMLAEAKRPVVCYGGGVNNVCAAESLETFLKKTKLFFAHTLMATGVVDIDDGHDLGLLGMHGNIAANRAVSEADVILAIGTRFGDRVVIKKDEFGRKAKIIQIDIDPSEINKNIKVDLGIVGDCGHILDMFCEDAQQIDAPEWKRQIEQFGKEDFCPNDTKEKLTPYNIMTLINKSAGKDAIYTTDVGQHQIWAAQHIKHSKAQSFLTSGGLGAMGFGYGAAIGAKCAFAHRNVVHITSEGSFLMNMNEASTAAAYKLNPITVILNNRTLGMVRQWQDVLCNGRHSGSVVEKKLDFASLAEGFGAEVFLCNTYEEFEVAFAKALEVKDKPVWIECAVDRNENVVPMNSVDF